MSGAVNVAELWEKIRKDVFSSKEPPSDDIAKRSVSVRFCGHCELPITTCRSCGKPIIFALSRNGKAWPVDAETTIIVVPEGTNLDGRRVWKQMSGHVPHHLTCPQAEQWRGSA